MAGRPRRHLGRRSISASVTSIAAVGWVIGGQSTAGLATYTRATVRLIEIRLLDGPNLYRLEPTVKIEVAIGRRRTWYGQRQPGAHAIVELGRRVPRRQMPCPVGDLAAWVRRLHRLAHADAWLADERGAFAGGGPCRSPSTVRASRAAGSWPTRGVSTSVHWRSPRPPGGAVSEASPWTRPCDGAGR